MPCLLPSDCLNEVFENLEDDKVTLHSCLLVSRLWCKTSVRILWRNIWRDVTYNLKLKVASAILSTLISCLPIESKELLHKNEIFISTPSSKPPLFNYVSFCKALSVNGISQIIYMVLINSDKSITSPNLKVRYCLTSKELLKIFMNQVPSLKTLYLMNYDSDIPNNISFAHFPEARDCLADLSELHCNSDIKHQLSQICHNLQSLAINFESEISDELKELVY